MIGRAISYRLNFSINVMMCRCRPVYVGSMSPIDVLLIECPENLYFPGAGVCCCRWVFPLTHAVHVIWSFGDGLRLVSAVTVQSLAIMCIIEGGALFIGLFQASIAFLYRWVLLCRWWLLPFWCLCSWCFVYGCVVSVCWCPLVTLFFSLFGLIYCWTMFVIVLVYWFVAIPLGWYSSFRFIGRCRLCFSTGVCMGWRQLWVLG